MMSFLSFILVIFPLVIIHEFGHYIVGKFLGAEPEEFSIGFGKRILEFQAFQTNWKIGWIPLGGYVKFKKVQFEIEFGEGQKTGEKLSAGKWFWISVAGPLANFLLTILIFSTLMFQTISEIQIGKSGENKILKVSASLHPSLRENFLGVAKTGEYFISENGKYAPYVPKDMDTFSKVDLSSQLKASLSVGPSYIWTGSIATLEGLLAVFSTKEGYKNMMGPVGIASVADEARERGLISILFVMASLSFAVGFFNLLPLAFLDGGRAVMAVYEVVSRKTISLKVLNFANTLSLILVVNLLIVGLFSDFMRIFSSVFK